MARHKASRNSAWRNGRSRKFVWVVKCTATELRSTATEWNVDKSMAVNNQAGSAGLTEGALSQGKSACTASESANKPQYKAAKFGGQAGAVSADESGVTKSVENENKKTRVGLPSIRKADGIMTVLPGRCGARESHCLERASSVPCSSTRPGRNNQQAIRKPGRKWKTLVFGRLEGGGLRIEEMQEKHQGERLGRRVRIKHALSGNRLCFPGPATAKNEWSVPGQIFKVGELLGRNVLKIEGGTALENEQLTVSAVLTREGEIAPGIFFCKR